MALACPVCDRPQADPKHLANHLAITASVHEAEHAAWLDEHVPAWADCSPSELGAAVEPHAEAVPGHEHEEHAQETASTGAQLPAREPGFGDRRTAETERVLEEARALTERMVDSRNEDEEGD